MGNTLEDRIVFPLANAYEFFTLGPMPKMQMKAATVLSKRSLDFPNLIHFVSFNISSHFLKIL